MAIITNLSIPYPDFKLHEIIDPEQFDFNNASTVDKVNAILEVLNQITDSVQAGGSGADKISISPIAPFTSNKLQAYLLEVISRLVSTTAGSSGASFIGASAITGVGGLNVGAQLASIKVLIDQAGFRTGVAEGRVTSLEGRTTVNENDITEIAERTGQSEVNIFNNNDDFKDHLIAGHDGFYYRKAEVYSKNETYAKAQFDLEKLFPDTQTFIATEGQGVFTITKPNSSYMTGKHRMKVSVGGVNQAVGDGLAVEEVDSKSITLSEGVPAGTIVVLSWFAGVVPVQIGLGHGNSHEAGEYDAIDVSKLKNYNVISTHISETNASLAEKVKDTLIDVISKTNLKAGEVVRTTGFYTLGDGGESIYSIKDLIGSELWTPSGFGFDLTSNGEIKAGTKKLKYVIQNGIINIRHFGAKGDYDEDLQTGANNTVVLQKVFDFAYVPPIDSGIARYDCPTVLFPSAFGYGVFDTITCKEGVNIDMTSASLVMISDALTPKKALVIGRPTTRSFNTFYKIDVRRNIGISTPSENDCGVEFINPYYCNIYLKGARSFSVGGRIVGDTKGAVYNTVNLGFIAGSNIFLDVIGKNAGWGNENLFIAGEFMNGVGNCFGVRIKNDQSSIAFSDNNLFIKPSFELNAGVGFQGVPFLIQDASSTKVIAMRLEDANDRTPFAARFLGKAEHSDIEVSAGGDQLWGVDDQSEKKTNYITRKLKGHIYKGKEIYTTDMLNKIACYYNGSTSVHTRGLHVIRSAESYYTNNDTGISIDTRGLTLGGSRAVCRLVDTSRRKKFIVQGEADTLLSYYIRCYDANGVLLLPTVTNVYAQSGNSSLLIATGDTTYWTTQTDTLVVTFNDAVKSASIGVGNGTNIRGFNISVFDIDVQYAGTWAGYEEINEGVNLATTPPTVGTWSKGKRLVNDNPTVGQPKSWICTVTGTPGTWISEGNL